MFTKFKIRINALLIAGSLVAIIAPALPAFAADDAVVDNTSNQAATTGQVGDPPAETPPAPPESDPTPPPAPENTPPTDAVVPPADQPQTDNAPSTDPIVNAALADPTPADASSSDPAVPPNVVSNTTVENNLNSEAQSGNANVTRNDSAGNATTGNADAIATILNLLQSSLSFDGTSLMTFNKDITGDQFGDIYIDPRVLSTASTIAKKPEQDLNINSSANALINNNINLSATSGNANVDHNGMAGNATSGNANALLNLINIINSLAVSHQSFLGSINIYGNLNGDILLPQELIDALLAATSSNNGSTNATINTDQSINNDINQQANTGAANVDHNGEAGNALTGNALNKLTVLNLTNRSIIGKNAMLVIVNVLGNWVGMIVDAPGSNTAVLGSGDSSLNDLSDSGVGNLNLNSNARINNNINLAATSGDANVSRNDKAGNATTGNATTSVNLINIINSQISVSDWFGILFINVYGNWNGSFGVNTAAGGGLEDPEAPEGPLIEFIPAAEVEAVEDTAPAFRGTGVSADATDIQQTTLLGATIDNGQPSAGSSVHANNSMILIALGGMACFGILGAIERRNKRRQYSLDRQIIFPTAP